VPTGSAAPSTSPCGVPPPLYVLFAVVAVWTGPDG